MKSLISEEKQRVAAAGPLASSRLFRWAKN